MLHDWLIERSFVLVDDTVPADRLWQILQGMRASHVIVRCGEDAPAFYLLARPRCLRALKERRDHETTVRTLLEGIAQSPVPAVGTDIDELQAPGRAVVLDGGRVVGFLDSGLDFSAGFESLETRLPDAAGAPVTRSLITDFPREVAVGETASLLALLSMTTAPGELTVAVPLGATLDLVVRAVRNFEIVGDRQASITVLDADETAPVRFRLKATQPGRGIIKLYLFSGGRALGSVTLETVVVEGGTAADVTEDQRRRPLPIIQGGAVPDLSLIILEHSIGDQPQLTIELRTREPHDSPRIKQQYGPVALELDPQQYFRQFFDQIQRTYGASALELELNTKGASLFRALFPEDLRAVLWELRDRIHSVAVQSAESWIPWELCKLVGRERDLIVEGPFFCEAFSFTRWIPDVADKLALRMQRVALVVPEGSGLASAKDERDYVRALGTDKRAVELVPATLDGVIKAMSSGTYDAWHFVCHGSATDSNPDRASIELDGGDRLRPEHLSGVVENLGITAPFVFLNACQSGLGAHALTGVGGWAARFLRAAAGEHHPACGAAVFLGTYWKIDDRTALAFTKAFYAALLHEQKAIGDAVRAARFAIRKPDDPTWLAYTVFSHPLARVT